MTISLLALQQSGESGRVVTLSYSLRTGSYSQTHSGLWHPNYKIPSPLKVVAQATFKLQHPMCWDYRCALLFTYLSILSVQKDSKSTETALLLIQSLDCSYNHIPLKRKFSLPTFYLKTGISLVAEWGWITSHLLIWIFYPHTIMPRHVHSIHGWFLAITAEMNSRTKTSAL